MTDEIVPTAPIKLDPYEEADPDAPQTQEEKAEDATDEEKREAYLLLSDKDPITGLSYDWLDIRDVLCSEGCGKALPMIFEYYQQVNPRMDAYLNYMITCSHFDDEEMGLPATRTARKRLALKVKKLMKTKPSTQSVRQMYHQHGEELLSPIIE